MKKLMCFVGVCVLCAVMTIACTSNEPKEEQEVNNSSEEAIEKNIEEEASDIAVAVKGEYFVIDREIFTDLFNTADIGDVENIEKWDKDDTNDEELETYYTTVSGSVIELLKEKDNENYLGILVNSYCDTIEDLRKISHIPIIICVLCEAPFPIADSFLDDAASATFTAFKTGETQYVYGEKGIYCYSYDNGIMSFFAVPSVEVEKQLSTKISDNFSTPTEQEIEIYNYINNLLEKGADTSQNPSASEIANYFGISEETVSGNFDTYKQIYIEDTYEEYCDKLTSEKYEISIDEVNEIWAKVYAYENK